MVESMVTINGRRVEVMYIADGHGKAMVYVNGNFQQWRCRMECGRWMPTYQIS